ncbi:MAG: SOS response-associated peptidase family protein [Dokdonella sp.]|uniref:SOS response-associated peptidase family protein n=1 Tax=Dokdonella sp. TaxID=2291710 RepID=UPI003266C271
MCYSAQVLSNYEKYVRQWGADISVQQFFQLYFLRNHTTGIRIPKAIDAWFANPSTDDERQIKALIDAYNTSQSAKLEQEIFRQRKRLADAERTLQTRTTKKALEDRRIATSKVERSLERLADLRRIEPKDRDARIFPQSYAPVIIMKDGRRTVVPMRYQCRPSGKPAFYDTKFPGTYNARRDNLEGFWKPQFGHEHAILLVNAFYENVSRHTMEQRALAEGEKEENVVLEFRPKPEQDMVIACLWSHWTQGDSTLDSFAAITDDPPAEVAAAGHDRCIIQIRPENADAWLSPSGDLATQYALLDDRALPFYEHRKAA